MTYFFKKKIPILALFFFIFPIFAQAAVDYNNIVSDAEFNNYQTMDTDDIQTWLESKNSYLADYTYMGNNPSPSQLALDPDKKYFKTRTAAEIIYNSAQESKVNPQFLLTMLEKEMSLITDHDIVENQLKYAMGYACPDSGGCDFRTSGFGKQVRAAAQQFRWFVDNIYSYNWKPGQPACADDPNPFLPCTSKGTVVTPANAITAAMYLYTPHVHGNSLFATLWSQFGFGGEPGEIIPPIITLLGIFPDGALVKAKDSQDGTIYLIEDGQKRAFADMSSLISRYDPAKVLLIDGQDLNNYENGAPIAHANYSVLESPASQKYLIDGLTKRLIVSDEAFRQLGFNPAEVEPVTDIELAYYQNGEDLATNASPFEEIWQAMDSETYYLVKDGKKHQIIDAEIIGLNYPELEIKVVTAKTLEETPLSTPIKLADGTLIKKDTDSSVYVISDGYKRWIPDAYTFEKLGYSWVNVKTVSTKLMNLHKIGEPLPSQELTSVK
ncbi:hypothetical protein KKH39_03920 [Patescibacteria group bacterium]|nr:hypothetical protein [Patescibacteria group bacterium]